MTSAAAGLPLALSIARTDHLRRSRWPLGGKAGHREWLHFCVRAPGVDVIVNFSVSDDLRSGASPMSERGRVVVLVRDEQGWEGDVDEIPPDRMTLHGGHVFVSMGESHVELRDGAFHLTAQLRRRPLRVDLRLVPETFPSVANNAAVGGGEPVNWAVVPRLRAEGTVSVGSRHREIHGAMAYHDHNWGQFSHRDLVWQWGYALPDRPDNPFSLVFARLLDRSRSRIFMQALLLWRGPRQHRVMREDEVEVASEGFARAARVVTVPRIATLLTAGVATDVPARLHIRARGRGDELRATFEPTDIARIASPNDHDLDTTVIHEVTGRLELEGHVRGEKVAMDGRGVFEFLGALQ